MSRNSECFRLALLSENKAANVGVWRLTLPGIEVLKQSSQIHGVKMSLRPDHINSPLHSLRLPHNLLLLHGYFGEIEFYYSASV